MRRKTRQIKVGGVKIGGGAPVSIQSMAKVRTSDVPRVTAQIKRLEKAGCEIIRVAVKDMDDARAISFIKRSISIPLVADIHFDYRLAIESIKNGADKIRLNPGNMKKKEDVERVIAAAREAHIPIRIGVNSGSVSRGRCSTDAKLLVKAAVNYIRLFEKCRFYDIILSLKASDVRETVDAYRRMSDISDYPLHLGVTASGPQDAGMIKSAIGIGSLLIDGVGDTIRVSLTAAPEDEVTAAKRILSAVGIRKFGHEIISCPTCGRCQVDLSPIVNNLERALNERRTPARRSFSEGGTKDERRKFFKIAIMGCEVNGPGEAREADIGIAAGKDSGILFVKGGMIKRVPAKGFVREIIKLCHTPGKRASI